MDRDCVDRHLGSGFSIKKAGGLQPKSGKQQGTKMSIADSVKKSIVIDNVGPIDHLTINIPPAGGVVVLHGGSGKGKTHAIKSVSALTDADARKSLRASDGFPSGKIDGLGVTVRLGRSNTVRGELECESLESGIDPSLLVDPGLKDPIAADSKRLATLVRLAGIKISAEKWSESVGQFADDIALKDLVSDDPVQTADKVRRRLHDIALKTERIQESKGAEGLALLKSIADVDMSQVLINPEQELNEAHSELSRLNEQKAFAIRIRSDIENAKVELDSAQSLKLDLNAIHEEIKRNALLMDGAFAIRQACESKLVELRNEIEQVEDKALEQQTIYEIHKSKMESAEQRLGDAELHLEQIAKLRKSVEVALPEEPTQEQFEACEERRKAAIEALQQQRTASRAMATKQEADGLIAESELLAKQAEIMRTIARSTDHVLEQSLIDAGFDSVKVHDGRLCVKSDRGLEPVSELSTGERWRLALDIAARSLPAGALLSVHQEGWQSLDNELKREVAAMAKERGLVIITAQVDEGELRSEVL